MSKAMNPVKAEDGDGITRQSVCVGSMQHLYELSCFWARRCTHVQDLSNTITSSMSVYTHINII